MLLAYYTVLVTQSSNYMLCAVFSPTCIGLPFRCFSLIENRTQKLQEYFVRIGDHPSGHIDSVVSEVYDDLHWLVLLAGGKAR